MAANWIILLLVVIPLVVQSQEPGSFQTPTAFTKGQTANLHLTKGEIIPFNKRITEIGANFGVSGSFICQTPGLYAFTFYGLTEQNWELWLEMMKNDELVASIYGYTYADYADAGNAAILHLNVGDKVYLKAHDDYDQTLYGQGDQIYTTFTGELLFADNVELDAVNSYGAVGFSGVMTVNASISDGSAVIYNKAITNMGNAYDPTTGTFTAPVEGAYLFHFHSLSHSDEEAWLELFHNGQYVVASYGYTVGSYADSGNSVVLHLKKGDTINVKARPGTDVKLYGDSDEYYTTFCGALLSPTVHGSGSGQGNQQEIAFSVGLTHNEDSTNGPRVVFDRVFINLGQNFNIYTGTFTASVGGIYAFHYHALGQKGQEVWMELYHNYIYVNSLYSHTSGSYGPGSNSAVLELVAGDTVYLDIKHHDTYLYGGGDEVYSTFSGYLLSPISSTHPVVG
ncbi:complement C1q tumor necrosis factor-related protein 4-like [Saccostrea cucullata]|uniref:complement C1q tumor necrosis factor-related protein 4-like n=1 Tax=Saccostrea cuccullata TaxID=36930 RepID=UPI002ED68287